MLPSPAPSSSGASPSSMMARVALQASGHMAIPSPQPTIPSATILARASRLESEGRGVGAISGVEHATVTPRAKAVQIRCRR